MSASSAHFLLRRGVPAFAAFASTSLWNNGSSRHSKCQQGNPQDPTTETTPAAGFQPKAEGSFHGLFPQRQVWQPAKPYPLWDVNWDGKQPPSTGDTDADSKRMRKIRKEGVTRHIILVRHGQYVETESEDEKRILTPLGREQADFTGKRLKVLLDGVDKEFGPCNIKVVRVSDMARAKETADIIASHLSGVERSEPDPDLNEGRPSHNIPGGAASAGTIAKTDDQHPRIEKAYNKYFYRSDVKESSEEEIGKTTEDGKAGAGDEVGEEQCKHEFEIIVCHANVIRYFLCRALQLPPEAWLRLCTFNCSLTYLTVRPTGTVSCRTLGDIGHIPYGKTTFSMHPGFNW